MDNNSKKIKWYALSFMCFSTLWGFGNIVNGFMYFNGIQVIFSWLMMFALFFIPYALMVGELGSAFKNKGGGVTSWVQEVSSSKLAYYAGWTYWAVHVSYIAGKSSSGLKAMSWLIFRNAETYDKFPTLFIQLAALFALLLFCYIASKGLNPLKKLATIAGSSMFVLSILYIILMFGAPLINPNGDYISINWSLKNLIPNFNVEYITSLSILVLAVGGIEKISPYVNKMEGNSAKEFPKSMIFAAIMVVVSALFGTIAMGMMFDPEIINASTEIKNSYISNGAYWAFQKLGQYYGVGDVLLIIYAACTAIGQFSTLVLSIDAPLRMLLDDENAARYVPKALLKKNANGAYTNGIKMVAVLSGSIILAQMTVRDAAAVLTQLNKLNSICMPFRYIWVFFAYIMLKKADGKFYQEYYFVKNKTLGMIIGAWCLFVTLFCCVTGVYSPDLSTLILNIATPVVLTILGVVLPKIREAQDKKEADYHYERKRSIEGITQIYSK